jgi:hypothetical protein
MSKLDTNNSIKQIWAQYTSDQYRNESTKLFCFSELKFFPSTSSVLDLSLSASNCSIRSHSSSQRKSNPNTQSNQRGKQPQQSTRRTSTTSDADSHDDSQGGEDDDDDDDDDQQRKRNNSNPNDTGIIETKQQRKNRKKREARKRAKLSITGDTSTTIATETIYSTTNTQGSNSPRTAPISGGKKKKKKKHTTESLDDSSTVEETVGDEDVLERIARASIHDHEDDDVELSVTSTSSVSADIKRECWGGWSVADWTCVKIRGPTYLIDAEKIPCSSPTFNLIDCIIFQTPNRIFNFGCHPSSHAAKLFAKSGKKIPKNNKHKQELTAEQLGDGSKLRPNDDDFLFIINFLVPHDPAYNLVCTFQRKKMDKQTEQKGNKKNQRLNFHLYSIVYVFIWAFLLFVLVDPSFAASSLAFERFVRGDKAYRDERLKILPYIVDGKYHQIFWVLFHHDLIICLFVHFFYFVFVCLLYIFISGANWFVKNAVGNRPAVLGKKITVHYFADSVRNYLECDVDVGSSKIASGIFKLVKGYAKSLTLGK